MEPFIRVAEVWTPSKEGSPLELAAGLFDKAPAFGAISRKMCFGRAEGLPGRAWDEGRPVLLQRFEGSFFQRTAAARAAGLSCAVALPIFVGGRLTSVVVLFCSDVQAQAGAIELWHNDPRISTDLTLADGYFGSTAPELEALTRDGSLSRGAGAPGLAWQREASVFIDNIGESRHFLRTQVAASAGILRALAIPCSTRAGGTWVLSLLSSAGAPIARRVESWLPDGVHLQRAYGFCEVQGRLPTNSAPPLAIDAGGPIAQAWLTGAAQAVSGGAAPGTGTAPADGAHAVLAIPVVSDDAVSEIVALYF